MGTWGGARPNSGPKRNKQGPKLATDNGRLIIPPALIESIQANARERRKTRADNPQLNPFQVQHHQLHPPGALPPKDVQMAMDSAIGWAANDWTGGGPLGQVFAEGLAFPGYPYLAELAQRPEYRTFSETIATEMTRKWIKFSGKGTAHQERKREREMAQDFGLPDPYPEEREADEKPDTSEKQEKISQLEEFLDNLDCRGAYRLMETNDGFFGRAHLFHEIAGNDGSTDEGRQELQSDIGIGTGDTSRQKVNKNNPLTALRGVEAVWTYPTTYNAINPLRADWYKPEVWYTMGMPIHASRLFTQIGRPVPDMLKPAYSFGGLSMSQLAQPYVNIWLETRESIGRLIHAFSVMVLFTDLQALMSPGGAALMERVNLFNTLRDNNGTFVLNKNTEDFKNVAVPLSGLHELQAQAQEHLCVQAGTLVETQRGPVPIEELTPADMVLTRGGLAPLKWVGITGHVDSLVEIVTDHATIRVTQCHPIWSETTKQFVPAQSVQPSHHLLGLGTSSRGNMAHPSHGVADGGGKLSRAITATRRAAACSIALFGRRIAAQFRPLMTSTIETMMGSTILSTTWNLLPGLSTSPAMFALALTSSTKSMPNNVLNVVEASRRLSPIRPCTVPTLASAKLTKSAMDGSRSTTSNNAASVVAGLNLDERMRAFVPTDVDSVRVRRVEVREVPRQPVYNLEVDGPPEFFANGVLVHNCSVARVPVAVYTGISPTGLNASSEGEIRIFENTIHAFQESRMRQNLTKTINFAQLSLWNEIDPDIVFEFVQLRELTEKEEAELRKLDAETDDLLMNGCQAISPEEVRIRVAGDDNGPHAGIDPDDMPEPPQPPPGEGGPGEGGPEGGGQPGEGEAPGQPKPGGRLNISGREAYTGVGQDEGEGYPGPTGGTFASLAETDPNAALHPGYQPGPLRGVNPVGRKKHDGPFAHDAEWNEADHPRGEGGKFGSGGGERVNFASAGAKRGESSGPVKPSAPRQKSITELTPEERAEWKKRAAAEMAAAEAKHGKGHKNLSEAAGGEKTNERVGFQSIGAKKQAEDAEWNESDHPRAPDGKFRHGAGSGTAVGSKPKKAATVESVSKKVGVSEAYRTSVRKLIKASSDPDEKIKLAELVAESLAAKYQKLKGLGRHEEAAETYRKVTKADLAISNMKRVRAGFQPEGPEKPTKDTTKRQKIIEAWTQQWKGWMSGNISMSYSSFLDKMSAIQREAGPTAVRKLAEGVLGQKFTNNTKAIAALDAQRVQMNEVATEKRRTQIKDNVLSVAKKHGFPQDRVEFTNDSYEFELNGVKRRAAGTAHGKERIRIYMNENFSPEFAKGLMAHEVTHIKFADYLEKARLANIGVLRRVEELEKSDGITDYSREYWEKYTKDKNPQNAILAVNETLAEMASVEERGLTAHLGKFLKDAPAWGNLYDEVNSHWGKGRTA